MDEINKTAADSVIHSLFPTPVGQYGLDHVLTKKEINFIMQQPQTNNMGNTTSQDNKILDNRVLSKLRQALQVKLQEFFNSVFNPQAAVGLRITQSWVNYTNPGQYHHRHYHPNSFVSGIYYVQTTSSDKIYFYNSKQPTFKLAPQNWNFWNSESWWFEAKQNTLMLFPSGLEHMVETVTASEPRISLSFNSFLVGSVGDASQLTLLELE